MAAWALSVLQAQDQQLWSAVLSYVAACPVGDMDEVVRLLGLVVWCASS